MSEPRVELTVNGQAVQQEDLNLIGEQAARATDWSLWDLLRVPSTNGLMTPFKGIIPSGGGGHAGLSYLNGRPVVGSSGHNDSRVWVHPFTAVLGSIHNSKDAKKALRDIRVVGHFGNPNAETFDSTMVLKLQLAGLAGGLVSRWDLVWAKMELDVPDAPVDRFVKDGDGPATSQNLSVTSRTKLTIGVTQGTEASDPTRPALPADSAGVVYFPLAYVFLYSGHTLTSKIPGRRIYEIFKPIALSAGGGVTQLGPANSCYKVGGPSDASDAAWSLHAPRSMLSPGMTGGVGRLIPISARDSDSHGNNVLVNTVTVLDDTVDWRKRVFKLTVLENNGSKGFPWEPGPGGAFTPIVNHGLGKDPVLLMGQSFHPDGVTADASLTDHSLVALFDDTASFTGRALLPTGAQLAIFVDQSDGRLKAWRNNVDANRHLFVWLEASGRYVNTDDDSE